MYIHSQYAGNLADCHKHQWLCYLLATSKPASYLETHAGAGCYSLAEDGRWKQGVGQLWPLAPEFAEIHWLNGLRQLNPDRLAHYPGSPWLAQQILGAESLVLFELEMEVSDQLRATLPDADVRTGDGFSSVVHLLESECFLMVDPPYTDLYDFERAMMLISQILLRQDMKIMLWYPRFNDGREKSYLEQISALLGDRGDMPAWRNELTFAEPQGSLRGSGVLVLGAELPTAVQQEKLVEQFAAAGAEITQLNG